MEIKIQGEKLWHCSFHGGGDKKIRDALRPEYQPLIEEIYSKYRLGDREAEELLRYYEIFLKALIFRASKKELAAYPGLEEKVLFKSIELHEYFKHQNNHNQTDIIYLKNYRKRPPYIDIDPNADLF